MTEKMTDNEEDLNIEDIRKKIKGHRGKIMKRMKELQKPDPSDPKTEPGKCKKCGTRVDDVAVICAACGGASDKRNGGE